MQDQAPDQTPENTQDKPKYPFRLIKSEQAEKSPEHPQPPPPSRKMFEKDLPPAA